MIKFLKCKNPEYHHIKMVYGDMLENWKQYHCDCGHDFEGFVEIRNDVCHDVFPAVEIGDAEDETKILPAVQKK